MEQKGPTQPTSTSGYEIPRKFGKKSKTTLDIDYQRSQGRAQKGMQRHPEDKKAFKKTAFGGMQTVSQEKLPSQRNKSRKLNKK